MGRLCLLKTQGGGHCCVVSLFLLSASCQFIPIGSDNKACNNWMIEFAAGLWHIKSRCSYEFCFCAKTTVFGKLLAERQGKGVAGSIKTFEDLTTCCGSSTSFRGQGHDFDTRILHAAPFNNSNHFFATILFFFLGITAAHSSFPKHNVLIVFKCEEFSGVLTQPHHRAVTLGNVGFGQRFAACFFVAILKGRASNRDMCTFLCLKVQIPCSNFAF